MTRIGAVTPEMMQQIVRVVTRQVLSVVQDETAPPAEGIPFLNTTGEEIPAYGVFQGHDTQNATHMPAIVIAKKPIDATANTGSVFVNGPNAVPNNDFGFAQDGPTYQVLTDGSATAGEGLGLTDDSFSASSGSGTFIALGQDDVREDVWLCLLQSGGGSKVKYFRLQEDAATTRIPIYAFEVFDDGSLGAEHEEIYSRFNWLLVAKVDQNLMAIWNGEKSRWDYVPGHCIVFNNAHNQNAAINSTFTPSGGVPQDAPDGTVGASYSHTITTASLTGAPTVTQLPPGLSATWNSGPATVSISGTPTTAGVYYIKLVGTPTGGASGDFRTRLVRVAINV